MTTMVIRPAAISDLESLCDLFRAFFDEDGITNSPEAIARNLRRMLLDERACFFVAVADGCVAGFSSGSVTFGVEFGCAAELEDLYIRPQYRGLGWARPLASVVLDWAEKRGATETFLVVTPLAEENQSLTKFYEKLGFRDSRRITMYRKNTKARETRE